MIAIGFLLVALALAFGIDLISESPSAPGHLYLFGHNIGAYSVGTAFGLGAVAGAAGILGVLLVVVSLGRHQTPASHTPRESDPAKLVTGEVEALRAEIGYLRLELEAQAVRSQRLALGKRQASARDEAGVIGTA